MRGEQMSLRVVAPMVGTAVVSIGLAVVVNLATSDVNSGWIWATVAVLNVVVFAGSLWLAAAMQARIKRIDREFNEREQRQSGGVNTSVLKDLLYWVDKLDEDVADDNISSARAFDVLRERIQAYLREEPGLRIAPGSGRDVAK